MPTWQIQEAKARLSEVIKDAERDGPQELTLHGRPVAVVVPVNSASGAAGQSS